MNLSKKVTERIDSINFDFDEKNMFTEQDELVCLIGDLMEADRPNMDAWELIEADYEENERPYIYREGIRIYCHLQYKGFTVIGYEFEIVFLRPVASLYQFQLPAPSSSASAA